MPTRPAAILLLATLARAQTTSHPDTVVVDNCVELPGGVLPDLCVNGTANACTRNVSVDVAVTVGSYNVTLPLRLSDGGSVRQTEPTCLEGLLPDWVPCGDPCFRIEEFASDVEGLKGCIEFHIDCTGFLPDIDGEIACIDFGEGTSTCEFDDLCECVQTTGCGWCPSSASCTRLLPNPSADDPSLARDEPVCSCDADVVLYEDDAANSCWPFPPPPLPPPPTPPPSPPPPPSLSPFPPGTEVGTPSPPPSIPSPGHPPSPPEAHSLPRWTVATTDDGVAGVQWLMWTSCLVAGVALYVYWGCAARKAARRLRLAVPSRAENGGGGHGVGAGGVVALPLQFLPTRLQYGAGAAVLRYDEADVDWIGQPVLLVATAVPFVLWLVGMLLVGVLTGMMQGMGECDDTADLEVADADCDEKPRPLGLLLLLLPLPLTLPLLLHVRRVSGTVYLLTAKGSLVLTLHCGCFGRCDAPRRVRYAQMLAQPIVKARRVWPAPLCCGRLACADLLFVASPLGGEVGFSCVSEEAATRLQAMLRERVAACAAGGGLVLEAVVRSQEVSAVSAEVVDPQKPVVPNSYYVEATVAPPLAAAGSSDTPPPISQNV